MKYVSVEELKDFLGVLTSSEDALLIAIAEAAEKFVESFTGRNFKPELKTYHYHTSQACPYNGKLVLFLDDDLLSLVAVRVNGVEVSGVKALGSHAPYFALEIPLSDVDAIIEVEGYFGFSAFVPEDIKLAILRLTAHLYRMRDSQILEAARLNELGVILVEKGIPHDVLAILNNYRRL